MNYSGDDGFIRQQNAYDKDCVVERPQFRMGKRNHFKLDRKKQQAARNNYTK